MFSERELENCSKMVSEMGIIPPEEINKCGNHAAEGADDALEMKQRVESTVQVFPRL